MTKQEEISNPRSCWNKAKYSEYLFIVLSRDLAMPATIRSWCNTRVSLGLNKIDDPQILEAYSLADKIEKLFNQAK